MVFSEGTGVGVLVGPCTRGPRTAEVSQRTVFTVFLSSLRCPLLAAPAPDTDLLTETKGGLNVAQETNNQTDSITTESLRPDLNCTQVKTKQQEPHPGW